MPKNSSRSSLATLGYHFCNRTTFLLWKGEPIFGIEEEKIYSDRRTDPIEKLSRKNSILNFRKLGIIILKMLLTYLKKKTPTIFQNYSSIKS